MMVYYNPHLTVQYNPLYTLSLTTKCFWIVTKPYEKWDILHINWFAGFLQQHHHPRNEEH